MTHPAVGLILGVGVGINSLPHPLLRLTSFIGMINSEVSALAPSIRLQAYIARLARFSLFPHFREVHCRETPLTRPRWHFIVRGVPDGPCYGRIS